MNNKSVLVDIENIINHNISEPECIWLIVTFRNADKYLENCLNSIFTQSCVNKIKIGICDDNSTDNSSDIINHYKELYNTQIYSFRNSDRKYKLTNVKMLLNTLPIQTTDIIAFLDGDDWLSDSNSIQTVLDKYSETGCWVTYGNYKKAGGGYDSCCREISKDEKDANNFRGMQWIFSHLFTFRYFLWKSIPESYFICEDDCQYKYTSDILINHAILDLAKSSRIKFIDTRIYTYNDLNELNDCKVNPYLQEQADKMARQKILKVDIVNVFDYTIILPYMKRYKHLLITVQSIIESFQFTDKKINIIVVEHDIAPTIKDYCISNKIEYIFIPIIADILPLSLFNRGLCFDVAVLFGLPSNGYVCHDVDIYIPNNFWNYLEINVYTQNVEALQTYANRLVHRINEETTEKLHLNKITMNDITVTNCLPSWPGSWGGSIFITKKLYIDIGGFDPDIFFAYSPDDQMFAHKIHLISQIGFANYPPIELYHQWHPCVSINNPYFDNMNNLFDRYKENSTLTLNYIKSKKILLMNI